MKTYFCIIAVLAAAFASAQDIVNDFSRNEGFNYSGTTAVPAAVGTSPYNIGYVTSEVGLLLQQPYAALTTNATTGAQNPDIIGTTDTYYQSGMWWNFSATPFKLPNGRGLAAHSFMLQSADVIPTVEYLAPTTGSFNIAMTATPFGGTTTAGSLVFETYVGGTWTTVYTLALSGVKQDTRTITVSMHSPVRFRWMLVRSGTALAQVSLALSITY